MPNDQDQDYDSSSSSSSSTQKQNKNPSDDDWNGWTCDELTPALCGLHLAHGQLNIRGVDVHYWIYTAMYPPGDEQQSSSSSSSNNNNHDDDDEDELNNHPNTLLPLVMIHGGPSLPHNYLLPLRQQACRGRTVIFYDQAGCGASTVLADANNNNESSNSNISSNIDFEQDYPWLLDPLYYATMELPTLIDHWGLTHYHVVGHAWGTMVAQLFALETKPTGLASLVLLGGLSDMRLWEQAMWDEKTGSLGRLPPFLQRQLLFLQANEMYDSSQYLALEQGLRRRFMCRTVPLPDCYLQAQATRNQPIFRFLFGPSTFSNGGSMAHFNTTGRLRDELGHLPVLLGASFFDIIHPSVVQVLYEQLPLSELVMFNKSGHVSAIDEPARTNGYITNFCTRVEQAAANGNVFVPERGIDPAQAARIQWISSWPFAVTFLMSLVLGFALARAILIMQIRKGYRRIGSAAAAAATAPPYG